MGIGLTINRALIATSAIINAKRKGSIENKEILIVFQQIFGDAVVIQNSLQEYTLLYPKSQGYKIIFLARPSVLSFMKANLSLPEDILFEEVDFKRFLEDYRYYKKTVKKYKKSSGTIIVPGTSFSAEVFSAVNDAKRKIGLIRSIDVNKPWIMAHFYNIAYTETVRPSKDDMMLQRHRLLLNYLGALDYKAKLPKLIKKQKLFDGHYAVMCPGSSKTEKCWPIERFAKVADYIIETYSLSVHLCGGKEEAPFAMQMLEMMEFSDRVVNHIGKTSFSDWSAIVQHADIVIGNDSATMHLAAAARVPAVCIAGVYDKYQFFPYKVDELNAEDRLPLTIIKDMPCEWCRTIGYNAGFGNDKCKKRIDSGLCSVCIDCISVEEVKHAIDKLMKEEVNE